MTKAELRAQLSTDTLAYVMSGKTIEVIPARKTNIKSRCSGKIARANTAGGICPTTAKISSIYGK